MVSVADAVAAVYQTPKSARTAKVNTFLAGKPADAISLQWRALFVTALRDTEVWPHGCKP